MRNTYYDNAKLILIFLVVLGHIIEMNAFDISALYSLYTFIYLFHMPAFALLSGYFSKKLSSTPKKLLKYTAYYIVFDLLYFWAFGNWNYPVLIVPFSILWYLISLVLWKAVLPLFARFKYSIVIALIIGVAVGYIEQIGYVLALSRTFVFFPFFLTGYFLQEKHLERLKTPFITAGSVLVITAALVGTNLVHIPNYWLYGSNSYASLGWTVWYAGTYRIAFYIVTSVMCIAFLTLVPKKRFVFSYMGAYTLDAYVSHGFFAFWIASSSLYSNFGTIGKVFLTIGITVIMSAVLLNIRPIIIRPIINKLKELIAYDEETSLTLDK